MFIAKGTKEGPSPSGAAWWCRSDGARAPLHRAGYKHAGPTGLADFHAGLHSMPVAPRGEFPERIRALNAWTVAADVRRLRSPAQRG